MVNVKRTNQDLVWGAIKGMGKFLLKEVSYIWKDKTVDSKIFMIFWKNASSSQTKEWWKVMVIAGAFDELDKFLSRAKYFDVDNAGRTNIEKLFFTDNPSKIIKTPVENSLLQILQMRFKSKDRNFYCLVQNGKICINSIVRKKLLVSIFRRIL